ncbi:MAG TPA: hypothetical protein VLM90_01725, partial [Candidatus Deferrimicrobium sp.]|nr:hypothetical protein [Candidatus Deferrimicrobium sp.]
MLILSEKVGVGRKKALRAMFVLLLLLVSVAPQAWSLSASLSPGDHTATLQFAGRERSAIVHVPRRAAERQLLPVVLNFHGGGGHGANQQEYSLLDAVAESESFITVYPNGTGR